MKKINQIQIGVIGSMLDKEKNESLITIAEELGNEIAKNGAILLFGFEEDFNSLSLITAKRAEDSGGRVVAFIRNCQRKNIRNLRSVQIVTGQERGGGREFSFILSCDAIISIAGGSGTLMEIAMAYQAGIPVIALQNTLGWSDKLINQFLDDRKRQKIIGATNAKEAVKKAIEIAKKF